MVLVVLRWEFNAQSDGSCDVALFVNTGYDEYGYSKIVVIAIPKYTNGFAL